jgi:type IV pilus assembly protein PilC
MAVVQRTSGANASAVRSTVLPESMSAARQAAGASSKKMHVRGTRKIVLKELPVFSRQFAAMLKAGMSVVGSLLTLEEQAINPSFKRVLSTVREAIEGGSTFSDGLAMFPDVFGELYVNMVRSGEKSGRFAETMRRIAIMLDSDAKLRRKVKSAMAYPVVVLCVALVIAAGLVTFIVPVFAKMFKDFGRDLPGPTQFLVDLSNFIRGNYYFIIPAIAVGVYLFKRWKRTVSGQYRFDAFVLKTPVFGMLTQKVAMARFAGTLAQLVRSGVPILSALEVVAKATGNKVIEEAILKSRVSVERGEPISKGLEGQPCIPTLMVRMMAAGEKTGQLDEMLDGVADTYDDEVETMLATLTSMLEPLLMVLLGVIIGGIVVSMFLPIFKLGEVVGGVKG